MAKRHPRRRGNSLRDADFGSGLGRVGAGGVGRQLRFLFAALGGDPSLAAHSPSQLEGEAAHSITSHIRPVLNEIGNTYQRRSREGQAGIAGYTGAAETALAPLPGEVGKIYDEASGANKGAADALAAYLDRSGAANAAGLNDRLGAAGQTKTVSPGIDHGAANAAAGSGFTGASELIADKGGQQAFARTLPGLVRLSGSQESGQLEHQLAASEASDVGQLRSQVPGMISDLLSSLENRELSRAGMRQGDRQKRADLTSGLFGSTSDRNLNAAIAKAGVGSDQSKLDLGYTQSLGYLTDASGQPILDASGNPIPTVDTTKTQAGIKSDYRKAHGKASNARDALMLTASKQIRSLVTAAKKSGGSDLLGAYLGKGHKKAGGGVDAAKLYQQALALQEVHQLMGKYGVRPQAIRQMIVAALKSGGVNYGGPPRRPGYIPGTRNRGPGGTGPR